MQKEESFVILSNPCRVADKQRKHIEFVPGRYEPVLPQRKVGIVFLRDSQPGQPDTFLETAGKPAEEKKAPPAANSMPEEFVFEEDEEKKLLSGPQA